ncbi:alpha-L-fucosidase [Lunatibacter salilacus]|uniref:alpha-L-fucosidase n=1 Tax=Lunatibacter salilacus TaxID=2483804 RepID=UPI00131BE26E|nr:alpha-L-fucosidase [Lunatibacter salilacus]
MNYRISMLIMLLMAVLISCNSSTTPPPTPVLPVPNEHQLAWQDLEFYGFVHFNMNTFTNMEWGTGAEDPELFNPTEFDANQWAQVCKDAGMKGIIITAKHHDGFCLWPTSTTEHSVKNSPYKNGEGDIIQEIADACKAHGLKFGVYLSPWDRNHAAYGSPEYVEIFRTQLRELLTQYGDIFEVWFDGANGGTGYYGGANEDRKVDKKSYYDWPTTYALVRELQPQAVIFGDAGPDVRWVGNEHGFAYETTWSNLMRDSVYGGMPEYSEKYSAGQENGTHWVPAEADVSIRPGWYYHEYEDHKVRSLPELLDIYYKSIGRNASLLLNFPVDRRGLIHENDIAQLNILTAKIAEDFAENLVTKQTSITSDKDRGRGFEAKNVLDEKLDTYWTTPDGELSGSITIEFKEPIIFNRFLVQEHIALGQRVKEFKLEAENEAGWETIAEETTIGYKRILRLPDTKAKSIRFTVVDARGIPTIANLAVYNATKLVLAPEVTRSRDGNVTLSVPEEGVDIFYSLDGSTPSSVSEKYTAPFLVETGAELQAIAMDPATGLQSEVTTAALDIPKKNWKVLSSGRNPDNLIDEDMGTNYISDNMEAVIDLGAAYSLAGFTYMPMQNRYMSGVVSLYECHVSLDGRTWKKAAEGEFGNIANSPILQRVTFDPIEARFIRLKAIKTLDGNPASFAELGVITER